MYPSLIEIGSKTVEKKLCTNKLTDRQTDTTKIMVTWSWINMHQTSRCGVCPVRRPARQETINLTECGIFTGVPCAHSFNMWHARVNLWRPLAWKISRWSIHRVASHAREKHPNFNVRGVPQGGGIKGIISRIAIHCTSKGQYSKWD